ncbi:nicotianamine synthase family protein [Bacillus canaveralius]|uniref:nicotianamine synthase family protein n=1 Tax=Bacillus canaveralius TaxID=1403243 RepID=UPI000F7B6F0E|nr:nicotianamine synthase family protein [Bacillus canaveralius]RSK44046.1 nicotianamine synthase [Bacillus canaveralius]
MKTLELAKLQEKIISQYKEAFSILITEQDLSPYNKTINRTLSELVATVSQPLQQSVVEEILNHDDIKSIRNQMLEKLMIAETLMENYYANRFSGKVESVLDFSSFIYWSNYVELIKTEIRQLKKIKTQFNSFAFVGTGPLPLSPILLEKELNAEMTCIDIDRQAYKLGKGIVQNLYPGRESSYILRDGASYDYDHHDLVWIASLVPNKEKVLKRVYDTNPDALVAIRSVDGIHQLLYESVDATKFQTVNCQEVGRTIANSTIINSTIFYIHKK